MSYDNKLKVVKLEFGINAKVIEVLKLTFKVLEFPKLAFTFPFGMAEGDFKTSLLHLHGLLFIQIG